VVSVLLCLVMTGSFRPGGGPTLLAMNGAKHREKGPAVHAQNILDTGGMYGMMYVHIKVCAIQDRDPIHIMLCPPSSRFRFAVSSPTGKIQYLVLFSHL
jgi:hypothetical protein